METWRDNFLFFRFLRATEIAFWCIILAPLIFIRLLPLSVFQALFLLMAVSASTLVGLIVFHRLIPRHGITAFVRYLVIITILGNIAGVGYILKPYRVDIDLLLMLIAASTGILGSRKFTIDTALLVGGIDTFLMLIDTPFQWPLLVIAGLRAVVILCTGIISHSLSSILISRTNLAEMQNRHLAMLLQSSNVASRVEDLQVMLTMQAEAVAAHTPVSACRISILSMDGDYLTTFGAYPIQPLDEPGVGIGSSHRIKDLPVLGEVISERQTRMLYGEELLPLTTNFDQGSAFFYYGVKTILLIPLNGKSGSVGILGVGEVEDFSESAYDNEKMHLLQTLANQIASAVESHLAYNEAKRVAQRLAMANQIANAISSTIEMDDLLDLLYEQLQRAIPSDTYYVGLYQIQTNQLEMSILYDEGVRYPREVVELGDGLAWWVLKNRQPLLINSITNDSLPVRPIRLGSARESESYLGVPMIASDRVIGILALASYAPYAFDVEDRELLQNVASQAALAIDNARQHAEVKEQARRDPLTKAYNHSQLLNLLAEAVDAARPEDEPVSLIMLDIDLFKQYNDQYGHMIGDQVLIELVSAITRHVKRTDIVGRWGGEEFAVGLPNANTEQALQVAGRIRSTLALTVIRDRSGNLVPSPTVSQGIATFPRHAGDYMTLVDVADQALYVAKNSGRDQIRTAN